MIKIEFEVSRIGYVLYRNGMNPVITASAETDEDLDNAVFTIRSEPPYIMESSFKADRIDAGTSLDLRKHLRISMDPSLLISAADTVPCRVFLEVSAEGAESLSEFCDTEILPFEYWPGIESSELIASFVTPNAECIPMIRSAASDILGEWNMDRSLEGYLGDRNRVLAMAAAVYIAIQRLGINYVLPPAGFESSGQRIRLPEAVVSFKEGTCVDLAVLYCSVLESVGLNTFVFFSKGHAFAGFWLVDEYMADMVSVDSASITRLIRNHDVAAAECTSLCVSRWTSFDDACAAGLNRLDNADDFICAVDIRRSRSSVLPLPTRRFENGAWVADREIVIPDAGAPSRVGDIYEETDSRMITKTDVWKRELLDISNRNPLVSMKAGAKAAALMISDPPSFEDSFLEGTQYTLMPRPQDWNGSKFYSEKPFETGYYIKNYSKACPDDIARGWIRTPLSDTDMQSSLKSVYRLYRRELEESGCNSLFVTVGVLRWFEDGGCKSPHYAPLILIPAELIKKQKNFILAKYDEDAVFNVTLAEKLRQEYDITITNIDPLPADENGIHVERIMQNVRRCIEGMEGWEVLDSTALGVFSFSQYAMWKDIDKNMERLCANPIVSAMVSGGVYHADEELGTGADPYGLCLTVAADGSQIRAVRAAGEGKSFVMHGPPGTGKSQTITNLISDSLYRGKTVLFVAEKRAALEVVQKRLDEIGIGNHCLELHSDKTEKSRVLDQLRKSLEPCKEYDVSELDSLLADLESMRSKLDSYVSELHMKRAWGFSAYECISRYEMHNTPGVRDLKISPDTAMSVKPEVISGLEDDILKACRAFEIAREMCDTGSLADIRTDTLAASLQFDIEELMDAAEEAADRAELLGKKLSGPAADNIASAAPLTGLLLSMDENVVSDENFACIPEKTEQAVSLWEKIISSVSSDSFLSSDRETLLETAEQAENLKNILSGLPRILQDNMMEEAAKDIARICTDLSGIYADRKRIEARWKPSVYSFDRGFGILDKWKEADGKMLFKGSAKKKFISDVSSVLVNPGSDFDSLRDTVSAITPVSRVLADSDSVLKTVRSEISGTEAEKEKLISVSADVSSALEMAEAAGIPPDEIKNIIAGAGSSREDTGNYIRAVEEWEESKNKLLETLKSDKTITTIPEFREYCRNLRPSLGGIFDWANWNYYSSKLSQQGFGSVAEAISEGADPETAVNSAYRSLYKTMINICRQESESLRMFNAPTFEGLIEKFRKTDASYTEVNRSILKYRLYKNLPRNMDGTVPDSEAGKLYKAISGSRMKKSIRTLLSEIPHILPRLCPCLLMSPQSVSQYITYDYPVFDLVIFDESSQITTAKAICSLGRAKAAVIAGDREQLPPTRFFQKRIEAEEGEEEFEDMESFLEDCLALNMPQTYLEWHYRSRHESLIAFSNRMFYDGKMLTFPSPDDQETRVRFVRTDGIYEKGKRCNPIEAEAVVNGIYRIVMDKKYDGRSIGVIAFSISQQNCIEDAMDDLLAGNPKFSAKLSGMSEPMFIKNLETVQGDERDIILFSIGYGPSRDGTVAQSFGPINRAGGGRRLNVAVSRARTEMIVYSSMSYTDIKLTPSSSNGVRGMKEFLRFAENGGRFQDQGIRKSSESSSYILKEIADMLKEEGYESRFSIGDSGFRVDLGVVDPEDPEKYILAILSDGEVYRNSDNTRDREFATADVLIRLGWNVMHVWSVDWFFSRKQTLRRIVSRINEILENRAKEPEPAGEPEETVPAIPEEAEIPEEPAEEAESRKLPYVPPEITVTEVPADAAVADREVISSIAGEIIESESPVAEEHLIALYRKAAGIRRLMEPKKKLLISNLRGLYSPEIRGNFVTYWAEEADREMTTYRVAESAKDSRDIACIPLIEIVNACVDVAESSGSVPRETCAVAVAKLFGFKRPGNNVITIVSSALDIAIEDGKIIDENGNLMVG